MEGASILPTPYISHLRKANIILDRNYKVLSYFSMLVVLTIFYEKEELIVCPTDTLMINYGL